MSGPHRPIRPREIAEYLTMGEVAAIENLKPGEGGLIPQRAEKNRDLP
jgi:hypothetical protein